MTDLETQSDVSVVTAPALAALAGIAHGFFLRHGGMSKG
ncbi:MAG: polyphenol oxidase, partial [Alphaproteobacteria bacterium]